MKSDNNRWDIRFVTTLPREDFIALYMDAGWWEESYEDDLSFIEKIIEGSFLFAAVFDISDRAVAMGRVLSDGCSDAYIQDVVVLESYRKQGIGGAIIRALTEELRMRGIDWIGLVGEPGTERFYSHLGFKTMKGYIPMKLS